MNVRRRWRCRLEGREGRTAGHVLAGHRVDGVGGFLGVAVHAHADAIALVHGVDVEGGEGGVAGG